MHHQNGPCGLSGRVPRSISMRLQTPACSWRGVPLLANFVRSLSHHRHDSSRPLTDSAGAHHTHRPTSHMGTHPWQWEHRLLCSVACCHNNCAAMLCCPLHRTAPPVLPAPEHLQGDWISQNECLHMFQRLQNPAETKSHPVQSTLRKLKLHEAVWSCTQPAW